MSSSSASAVAGAAARQSSATRSSLEAISSVIGRVLRAQLSDGSGGIVERSANSRPLRRSTAAHRPVGVRAEELLAQRRLDDPGLLLELRLELAGTPAGVPGVDARAAHGRRHGLGVVERRRGRSRDRARPARPPAPGPPTRRARSRRRATTGPPTKTGSSPLGQPLELGHRLGDGRRRRPVEYEAHRAVVAVLRDQDDRAVEVRGPLASGRRPAACPRSEAMLTPAGGRGRARSPARGEPGELRGQRPAVRPRLALVVGRRSLERHRAGVVADRAQDATSSGASRSSPARCW